MIVCCRSIETQTNHSRHHTDVILPFRKLDPFVLVSGISTPQMATYEDTMVIALLGRTGSGKSATGNTILGQGKLFDTKRQLSSATSKTSSHRREVNGTSTVVIDTPGLFDTRGQSTHEYVLSEISKCVGVATTYSDGIDAFVLTLNADERFTEESTRSLQVLRKLFGEGMLQYSIVLFTRKDQLEEDDITLDELLQSAPPFLKRVVSECGGRVIGFDNTKRGALDRSQVAELMGMIRQIRRVNGNRKFSNKMMADVKSIVDADKRLSHTYDNDKESEKIIKESPGVLSKIKSAIGSIVRPVVDFFKGLFS